MATTTTNLGLTLPVGTENVSLSVLNGNMSLIDAFAGNMTTSDYESGVDADNYIHTGYYHVGISAHSPYGSDVFYGILIVYEGNNGHVQQIAVSGNNKMFFIRGRNTSSNSFSNWVRLAEYMNEDVTATAGTNITINWQRCKKVVPGLAVVEIALTTSSSIAANSTILSGLPNIGGNSQHFAAFSDAGTLYPLTTVNGDIKNLTTIGSGVKIRFIVTYYYV